MYNAQLMKVARFAKLMQIEKGNQKHIDLYVDLLQEEFDEFRKATRANDVIEIRDGLADIWVIATQLNMLNGWCSAPHKQEDVHIAEGFEFLAGIMWVNIRCTPINSDVSGVIRWCERFARDIGFNLSVDVDEVMRSNLSKFCSDEAVMLESIEAWRKKGVNVYGRKTGDVRYQYAIYADEGNGSDYPKGKLMKPLHYVKPDLAGLS